MRTTLTLEPDVEQLVKRAMHDRDASFKRVINDALRAGLRPAAEVEPRRFAPLTFDMGRPLVDVSNLNALADELEDLAVVETLRRPR